MLIPRNPSYGWSLVCAMILSIASVSQAQTPAVDVVFKEKGVIPASAKRARLDPQATALEILAAEQPTAAETPAPLMAPAGYLMAEVQIVQRPSIQPAVDATNASNSQNTDTLSTQNLIESRSVACRTANEWLPAKQLRQHAQSVQQLYCEEDDCTRQAANAIAKFLQLQADHQQDLAAAIALRGYYARSAIVEQLTLLEQSNAELQKQRERQSSIQQKGLAAAIDLTSLDREAIALNLQQIQLQQRDRQLKQSLNEATHTQYDWETSSIEPLEVREQTLDANYLQQFAATHRHDLLALQCLSGQINSGTAPMLSSVVNSVTGLASLPLPKRCFLDRVLGREDNSVLTNNLRRSIALACETQASTIRREISEKSIALELAYQRIRLSQETTASWNKRLEQLQRLTELGDSRPADLALAQASLLGAKSIEIERRLEAKLAEIALAEACGGLAVRCCQGQAWLIVGR